MRGYRLNGRVARASRVVVGEYREGAAAGRGRSELIGADEAQAATEAVEQITAADTVPLDETTLREIFGSGDDDPEPK